MCDKIKIEMPDFPESQPGDPEAHGTSSGNPIAHETQASSPATPEAQANGLESPADAPESPKSPADAPESPDSQAGTLASSELQVLLEDQELMAELADFFAVFGDMTRVRILALLRTGPMNVGQLAEQLDMSDSAVSHQLRVLKSNDLLRTRRDGRYIYYRISDEHVNTIFDMGLRHLTEG